jgi:PAS domain-containing protein
MDTMCLTNCRGLNMRLSRFRGHTATILIVVLLALQCALVLIAGGTPAGILRWLSLAVAAALLCVATYELRQQARREQDLDELRQLMAAPGAATPLQQLAGLALRLIPQATACAFHLTDEQGRLQYAQGLAPVPQKGTPAPVAPPALGQRALQERRTLRADELAPGAALAERDAASESVPVCAVPISPGEMPLGVLVISAPGRTVLGSKDQATAVLVAMIAGLLLREQRLRQALRTEIPHGDLILNTLTDALVVLDQEDRIVLHNPALAAILGPDLGGLVGSRLQVRGGDQRVQRLAYLVGDTSSQTATHRHLTIDEPIHAVLDVEITPVRDQVGRGLKVVTMHDVTSTSDALDAQTLLLRATAHGLQAPLAALSAGPANQGLTQPARHLERLRQDLLAVAEPMENLSQSALPTVAWEEVLARLQDELPHSISRRLQVHSHPALSVHPVPDRWLDHLLLTLIEEAGRPGEETLSLDVEGRPGELVFSVRASASGMPEGAQVNSLGFGASQATLSLHVARRLAEALGGHLWQAQDSGALRYQLILPTIRRRSTFDHR